MGIIPQIEILIVEIRVYQYGIYKVFLFYNDLMPTQYDASLVQSIDNSFVNFRPLVSTRRGGSGLYSSYNM